MSKVVSVEEMYRRRREGRGFSELSLYSRVGVPPIVVRQGAGSIKGNSPFNKEVGKRIRALPAFGIYAGDGNLNTANKIIGALERKKIYVEKQAKDFIVERAYESLIADKRAYENGRGFISNDTFVKKYLSFDESKQPTGEEEFYPMSSLNAELVVVTGTTLGLAENASYSEIFNRATLYYGLVEVFPAYFLPPAVCIERKKPLGFTHAIFARDPKNLFLEEWPTMLSIEITSRTRGGITLGAVDGSPDWISPDRNIIFARRYFLAK